MLYCWLVLPAGWGVSSELQSTAAFLGPARSKCAIFGLHSATAVRARIAWAAASKPSACPAPKSSGRIDPAGEGCSAQRTRSAASPQCAAGSAMSGAGSAIAAALADAGLSHLAPNFEHLSLGRFKGLLIQVGASSGERGSPICSSLLSIPLEPVAAAGGGGGGTGVVVRQGRRAGGAGAATAVQPATGCRPARCCASPSRRRGR